MGAGRLRARSSAGQIPISARGYRLEHRNLIAAFECYDSDRATSNVYVLNVKGESWTAFHRFAEAVVREVERGSTYEREDARRRGQGHTKRRPSRTKVKRELGF